MKKKRHFRTPYDCLFGDSFLNFRDDMLNNTEHPEDVKLWEEEIYKTYKPIVYRLKKLILKFINW